MKGSKQTTRVPVATYTEVETITISGITMEDALVLLAIQRKIGGSPSGPRGASERFGQALREAGVKWPTTPDEPFGYVNERVFPTMKGSIYF